MVGYVFGVLLKYTIYFLKLPLDIFLILCYTYIIKEGMNPGRSGTMWYVSDVFGFAWGDVVETLEEAQAQLRELREDPKIKELGIELEIARM